MTNVTKGQSLCHIHFAPTFVLVSQVRQIAPKEERRVLNVRKRRLRGKVPCLGKQDYAATMRR